MISNVQIDYHKAFAALPEIMGMPMKLIHNKWCASRKIDGSYSPRPDKLVCRLVDENGIQILEQGGECITLFTWMLKYGGCKNNNEVKMRLIERSVGYLPIPDSIEKEQEIRYVDRKYLDWSIENRINYQDELTLFLKDRFGPIRTEATLRYYNVGVGRKSVAGQYCNMTQFWYINELNEILHDKLMQYKMDGHRDKEINPSRFFKKSKGYVGRCLFGAHLIPKNHGMQVYVVESEKTALVASLYFSKGLWLACGGKNNLKRIGVKDDWKILPDVDAFDEWERAFPGKCVKWWESYKNFEVGPKWDIGDLILECLI